MISLMNLTVDMYRRIKIRSGDDDTNLNVACAGICVRIMLLIVYLSESF